VVGTVADPAANFEANALGTFRVLGYSPRGADRGRHPAPAAVGRA
jgi:hypothetical protein